MKMSSVKINVGPILVGWTNLTTKKVAFPVIPSKNAKILAKKDAHLLVLVSKANCNILKVYCKNINNP